MSSAIAYYSRKRQQDAAGTGATASRRSFAASTSFTAFEEKIRAAERAGIVSFAPWLDARRGETADMRKAYPLMMNSPVVKPALLSKLYAISSLDLQTIPASDSPADVKIADFVRYAYTEALEGELAQLAETILLPGWIHGESISEAVPREEPWSRGEWRGKRFYRAIKTKEKARAKYDKFHNIIGVVGPNADGETVEYPTEGFVIFQNLPALGGNGISDLRAAYGSWWMRDTIEKLHAIHLEKFTSPYLMATYPQNAGDGTLSEVETELEKAKSRMWGLFPEEIKVNAMTLATRGEAEFLAKTKDLEEKIVLSITGAFLQMLTSGNVSDIRGDSGTQKTTAELFIWAGSAKLCSILNRQGTPWLVKHNFGPSFDYPKVALGGISYEEMGKFADLVIKAQQAGFRVSKKAFGRQVAIQEATGPDDALVPTTVTVPGGVPGGGVGAGGGLGGGLGAGGGFPSLRFSAPPTPSTRTFADIALPGADGRKVENLLARAEREGVELLAKLTATAARRLANKSPDAILKAKRLFSADELGELADQLAATNATAELLGRARIAEQAEEAERKHGVGAGRRENSDTTGITQRRVFDDNTGPLKPMPPQQALEYFLRLIPRLGVDPKRFGPTQERQAFTLAAATDEIILTAIQDLLAERLQTGEGISTAPAAIDEILDAAGVSPANPQYAEMVTRTNMIDSYNTGAQRELTASKSIFPVYRYSNPDDGRSRPEHAARNGKYYSADVPFVKVRGTDVGDAANCRCTFVPVSRWDWEELEAQGATVEIAP